MHRCSACAMTCNALPNLTTNLLCPESTIRYADVPWILAAEEPKQEELQRVVLYGGCGFLVLYGGCGFLVLYGGCGSHCPRGIFAVAPSPFAPPLCHRACSSAHAAGATI